MDKISNIYGFLRLINFVGGHIGGHPGVSLGESKVLRESQIDGAGYGQTILHLVEVPPLLPTFAVDF